MTFERYSKLIDKLSYNSNSVRAAAVVLRGQQDNRKKRKYFIDAGVLSVEYEHNRLFVYAVKNNIKYFIAAFKREDVTNGLNACCKILSLYKGD